MEEDVIKFNTMPSIYWDMATKISYLQRRVIVHSIIYYEMDDSCITDRKYDMLSQQLVRMQNEASAEEWQRSRYYYAMHDFDGSTGFDIPHRLTPEDKLALTHIARHVHQMWAKEHGQTQRKKGRAKK